MIAPPVPTHLDVEPTAAGLRIDSYLADRLTLPRNRIQRWLREGLVRIDGRLPRPAHRVAAGERIEIAAPAEPAAPALLAEPGDLVVLHEDEDLIVVDKPAGLVVHPGAGRRTGTLSHHLLHRYPELIAVGHPQRPGIVHRLDRDTTGVLVVARNDRAYRALTADFAARRVGKLYLALVWGSIAAQIVDQPIGRHARDRKRMAVRAGGRPALTEITPLGLAAGGRIAAAAIHLKTGRTHQIRVHLQQAKHPLLGDPVYGEARWKGLPTTQRAVARDFPRCALHAWVLALRHPRHREILRFESPIPADLARLWSDLGGQPQALRPLPLAAPWSGGLATAPREPPS